MIGRRDLLLGSSSLGAAALAMVLKPHRHVSLLNGVPLREIIPIAVGEWQARDVSDLLDAREEGDLMSRLYGQTVERIYRNSRTSREIMMLFAYGSTQSNDLQLHRPEVCYPAFGFEIVSSELKLVPLTGKFGLPVKVLHAHSPSADETVIYWSRLGSFLPTNGGEQRIDRLKTTISGIIADGLLARLSMINSGQVLADAELLQFIHDLLVLIPVDRLPALIGTNAAKQVADNG